MSTPPESKVDVLVIGAGPAGLMAANALVHAGIKVRIIEKRAAGLSAGQADGLQPRTLEVMKSYDLADRLLKDGGRFYRSSFYYPGPDGGITRAQQIPTIGHPTARYPFILTRHQGYIEDVFQDSMKSKGLVVQRSTIPTAIQLSEIESELTDPQAYPVKVTLARVDGNENDTEVVHAKFVIGTDGAHSWVRNALGIKMDGDQTDSIWGVVDMHYETDLPDHRGWLMLQSNNGTLEGIPREDDMLRCYIQLSGKGDLVDPTMGRIDRMCFKPEELVETAAKIVQPYYLKQVGELNWWTIYIIGQRVAQQCSVKNRVFIAGDACHTHSPKGGQGMNAGVNDAHNLAWKLAWVIRGWADISLLQTYEFERLKFAQDLINFDKIWSKLFIGKSPTKAAEEGRPNEEFEQAFKKFGGFASGIGIRYAPSIITHDQHQSCAPKLVVGERMIPHTFVQAADIRPVNIQDKLPSDSRFKVLVFAGDYTKASTMERLHGLEKGMNASDSFLHRYGQGDHQKVFDVLCVCAAKKEEADYMDVPALFRSHWSKVLLDDTDMHGREGGGGFAVYGIDPDVGAIVVVRPDGYVGIVAPYERLDHINAYFSAFMSTAAS